MAHPTDELNTFALDLGLKVRANDEGIEPKHSEFLSKIDKKTLRTADEVLTKAPGGVQTYSEQWSDNS